MKTYFFHESLTLRTVCTLRSIHLHQLRNYLRMFKLIRFLLKVPFSVFFGFVYFRRLRSLVAILSSFFDCVAYLRVYRYDAGVKTRDQLSKFISIIIIIIIVIIVVVVIIYSTKLSRLIKQKRNTCSNSVP